MNTHLNPAKYRFIYIVIYVLIHLLIFAYFIQEPGIDTNPGAKLPLMVYGGAEKPYVYRNLLPTTVRIIIQIIPLNTKNFLDKSIGENAIVQNIFSQLKWKHGYFIEYAIALILMYLSLWGFCFSIRYLFTRLFRAPVMFVNIVPIVALLCLPPFFKYTNYVYDLPNLFLFTLGLGLMARQKWMLFILVFPIACLNKETAILLTIIFVIHFLKQGRLKKPLFRKLLIFQLVSFILIKISLTAIFRNNPNTFVEFHLLDIHNLSVMRHLLLDFSPTLKYTQLLMAIILFAIVWMISYKWSNQPTFLKDGLWILVPLFVLTTLFAWWDEWRDYYEAYPIVLLLVLHSVGDLLGINITKLEKSSERAHSYP